MRSLLSRVFLAMAIALPSAIAGPISRNSPPVVVTPGPPQLSRITKDNTLNGTFPNATWHNPPKPMVVGLPISIKNNFNGGQLYAYVTGLDPQGHVVMLQPNGQWYYPTSTSTTVPQPINAGITLNVGGKGATSTWYLPTYMSSGRIYISEGELVFSTLSTPSGVTLVQPDFNNPSDASAGKNWGFVELTNIANGLWANLSFVDFVGLPLGMTITSTSGSSQTVEGVNSDAVRLICNGLSSYAGQDGAPWDQLCMYLSNGTPLRAVAPQKYIAVHPGAFQSYYSNYVDQVWNRYSSASTPLTIDSQGTVPGGTFTCTTSGNNMNCAGGSRPFVKPSASEIFGCDGTFGGQGGDNNVVLAATARICAAFNRNTLMLNGGNLQPGLGTGYYYGNAPTNRYSRLVHSTELDGRGYAFPYDDVNPTGDLDVSGTLSTSNAAGMTITVGGA